NLRVLLGFVLCSFGLLLALAGLSKSVTGTVVTTPDSTKWYVDGVNGSDSNDCKSSTTACKTIGHAISLAASGGSITVAAATYPEKVTIGVSLKLTGAGASNTVIDGGGVFSTAVVTISPGVVATLSKFTIRNGFASEGGGINNSGTLTINNSVLSANTAGANGGGIFSNGTLTINSSTLSANTVLGTLPSGGGIYNEGALTINKSTLNGNTAGPGGGSSSSGGGIYNTGGTVMLTNTTLSGNKATGVTSVFGGGI